MLAEVFLSPIGPALVLLIGAATLLLATRWLRQANFLTLLALFFAAAAALLYVALQYQPVVPTFSRPWQPLLQGAINLYWISDSWNSYVSGLILLLGGLGILLDRNRKTTQGDAHRLGAMLSANLGVLAGSLLFVNAGNLLTALLAWVFLDLAILLRAAIEPLTSTGEQILHLRSNEARIVSLLGALLLLIGLLPAGAGGPAQEFARGSLPQETLLLMLLAAALRAGVYPFHLWLLPRTRNPLNLSERLLDHMAPVLCGLWLFGWTFQLGAANLMLSPAVLTLLVLALLATAIAAWTAEDQLHHATFVLVGSAGVAVLAGALALAAGPAGMFWATTAFALGGGLWLVGDQAWRSWGWQLPVSFGALALAGAPFTPGFLAQPSLARLLSSGPAYWPVFALYVLAQGILVAALLRSWSMPERSGVKPPQSYLARLLLASLCLALPLAVSGILPQFTETLAGLPNTIPPSLGRPPSAVAEPAVWIAFGLPLALGLGLVWLRPRVWPLLRDWPDRISDFSQLQWLFRFSMWGIDRLALAGNNAVHVVEGAGYLGWFLVFVLLALLLLR
jgi:hypothetical protein